MQCDKTAVVRRQRSHFSRSSNLLKTMHLSSRSRLLLTLCAAVLPPTGCGGTRPASSDAVNGGGPSLNLPPPSCPDAGALSPADAGACVVLKTRQFSRDIVPLFDSCAGEICHSFANGQIATQIGIPADECCGELKMIEPGHPERSYVLLKLRGQTVCGGSTMPLDQPAYSNDDDQAIADWICEGAKVAP